MKALRALMLMLVLSVCAYAGNMANDFAAPPPPPSSATVGSEEATSTDLVTEITLNLLHSVLSLL
jgi:hypothetical protein